MKKENKWPLVAAALAMMAFSWANNDFSTLNALQPQALVPVIIIAAVVFLLKTGALAAMLIGLRKLWNWIKKREH